MKSRQIRGDDDTITIVAGEAITARRFVTIEGKHTAAEAAIGVADFNTDSGDNISVCCGPIEVVESGAAISALAAVEADASGRAVTKNAGVTIGRVIDAATAAGEFIRVAMLLQ